MGRHGCNAGQLVRNVAKRSSMREIEKLIEIMAKLRHPEGGCPWDREQDFRSISPYTIEEAYEVDDAIRRGDMQALKQELGDLLFQVVYHARMAEECDEFNFADVAAAINRKMIRRHPHVFGTESISNAADQTKAWEEHKAKERNGGALSDVPTGLPGLTRAVKLSKRAARVGFDWENAEDVRDKLTEEIEELDHELKAGEKNKIASELGDVLFALANLARHLDIDPEQALRDSNSKFEQRFGFIEKELGKAGRGPADASLDEMEQLWNRAKKET